jgi:hypothetical protein
MFWIIYDPFLQMLVQCISLFKWSFEKWQRSTHNDYYHFSKLFVLAFETDRKAGLLLTMYAYCIFPAIYTICDKVCQWLAPDESFSQGTPVSSTNKTYRYDITEILLKMALNIVTQTEKSPKQLPKFAEQSRTKCRSDRFNGCPLSSPWYTVLHERSINILSMWIKYLYLYTTLIKQILFIYFFCTANVMLAD